MDCLGPEIPYSILVPIDTENDVKILEENEKIQTKLDTFPHVFNHIFPVCEGSTSDKSIFWTNQKLSLMVACLSSVSISCFKFQISIGHF